MVLGADSSEDDTSYNQALFHQVSSSIKHHTPQGCFGPPCVSPKGWHKEPDARNSHPSLAWLPRVKLVAAPKGLALNAASATS